MPEQSGLIKTDCDHLILLRWTGPGLTGKPWNVCAAPFSMALRVRRTTGRAKAISRVTTPLLPSASVGNGTMFWANCSVGDGLHRKMFYSTGVVALALPAARFLTILAWMR